MPAKARADQRTITVVALCVGAERVVPKQTVTSVGIEAFGLQGDRHAGELRVPAFGRLKGQTVFNERQWSAVSSEDVAELERRLGIPLPVGSLGENLRVSGVPRFSKTRPGTRIRFPSGAVLWVSGESLPCAKAARYLADANASPFVAEEFVRLARGLRGLVGWVEAPGLVTLGDMASFEF